jgi:hypothetical protein
MALQRCGMQFAFGFGFQIKRVVVAPAHERCRVSRPAGVREVGCDIADGVRFIDGRRELSAAWRHVVGIGVTYVRQLPRVAPGHHAHTAVFDVGGCKGYPSRHGIRSREPPMLRILVPRDEPWAERRLIEKARRPAQDVGPE